MNFGQVLILLKPLHEKKVFRINIVRITKAYVSVSP